MAFYAGEEELWKCYKHPSKRRRSGICPLCLKQRLSALCPDCANVRPCSCCATTSSSSSSTSSSFSLRTSQDGTLNKSNTLTDAAAVGSGGRIATLIDGEPPFRRSRSAALPFFRSSRFSVDDRKKSSIWSVLWWPQKSRRENMDIEVMKMRRSRSVAASITSANEIRSSPAPTKGKGWYFPSPMKVFRHSKASKIVQERSPLHRG